MAEVMVRQRRVAGSTPENQGRSCQFAPGFAPAGDNSCESLSCAGMTYPLQTGQGNAQGIDVSSSGDKEKEPLTTGVNSSWQVGGTELESVTSTMSTWRSNQLS
jgi:hypothetical protein